MKLDCQQQHSPNTRHSSTKHSTRPRTPFARRGLFAITLSVVACGGAKGTGGGGNGDGTETISGNANAGGPIGNAIVVAHAVTDSQRGDVVAESSTQSDGSFTLELNGYRGGLVIEATMGRLAGDDGRTIVLAATDRVSAALEAGESTITGLQLTPITTMAEALGGARFARRADPSWADSQHRALELIGNHFGSIEPLFTVPMSTTDLNFVDTDEERYGWMMLGLNRIAGNIEQAGSASSQLANPVAIGTALAADLASSEALFDGNGGTLSIGTCPAPEFCSDTACSTVCDIGPRTVRSQLAQAILEGARANAVDEGIVESLRNQVALNEDVELFGTASTDTIAPLLTVHSSGFYIDPTETWWTANRGPTIEGTVGLDTSEQATVQIIVGTIDTTIPVNAAGTFSFTLPAQTLEPAPATTLVTVIAADSAGNRAREQVLIRLDDEPATAVFEQTQVRDERFDEITFGTPVVHDHVGPIVNIGAVAGCPQVAKHTTTFEASDDNPLLFTVTASDAGVGLDPSSAQLQFRRDGGPAVGPALAPTAFRELNGATEFDFVVGATVAAELGTDIDPYTADVVVNDFLGAGSTQTACINLLALAAPLRTTRVSNGNQSSGDPLSINSAKLSTRSLPNNNLSALLNGVTAQNGAGVIVFDVENYHPSPVFFEVDASAPRLVGNKSFRRSAALVSVQNANLNCLPPAGATSNCVATWQSSHIQSNASVNQSIITAGVRIWDITDSGAADSVSECDGCLDGRFQIPAANGDDPAVFRVMLMATNLRPIRPGSSQFENHSDFSIGNRQLTGVRYGAFTRCTDIFQSIINGQLVHQCREVSTYRIYRALSNLSLSVRDGYAAVQTAVSAKSGARELNSMTGDRATVSAWTWSSAESSMPPRPFGLP